MCPDLEVAELEFISRVPNLKALLTIFYCLTTGNKFTTASL